jgi:hypothetical protein
MRSARYDLQRPLGSPGILVQMESFMKALAQAILGATALTALVATIAVAQERVVDINKVSEAGSAKDRDHPRDRGQEWHHLQDRRDRYRSRQARFPPA